MQTYEPPKWNRANTIVPLVLYICALVCYATTSLTPLPVILQVVGLVTLIIAISLTSRYSLSSRVYVVTEETEEHPCGCIRILKVQGTRTQTLCDLSLAEAVDFFPHKKRKELEAAVGSVGFYDDYRRNLTPAPRYDLVVRVQNMRAVLVLELDASFASLIESRVAIAKAQRESAAQDETEE